ncbi:MAG: zinc-dependent peptidase [Prochloraceae cyanobacterium]|nr:zinc-dependent peptidase [Prochloraceae cyanobacterium]
MIKAIAFLLAIIVIIVLIWLMPTLTWIRRQTIKDKPFPSHWLAIIKQNIPIYFYLREPLQKRLQGHVNVILAEKQFVGCGGLQITDEIKLTIAAIASLLLLNERGEYYPKLCSILVYPSTYVAKQIQHVGNYVVEETKVARLGESWSRDRIVLSWEQIERDIHNWNDGHNVILHEFAHQLDAENGTANGVPILKQQSDYIAWALVFREEYQKLRKNVERGLKTVIDPYGTINPAEFFAVATETFFEKSKPMALHHPALYNQLKRYYKLDPVEWI